MKNIKIGIAYHKKSLIIKNNCYLPIQVGSSLYPDLDLGICKDNTGDNISGKNDYYCELTALYWLWKNVKADYKGLCHYRRLFTYRHNIKYKLYNMLKPIQSMRSHLFFNSPCLICDNENHFESDAERTCRIIDKYLDRYDIICPKKQVCNRGSYWHFAIYGIEIMDILRDVVKRYFPHYYDYTQYKEEPSSFYFGNMSVMKNDLFEEYCIFLFNVLEKVEQILLEEGWYKDLHNEKAFSRKLGYFGEYLTDIYIRKKKAEKIRIKELYVTILK